MIFKVTLSLVFLGILGGCSSSSKTTPQAPATVTPEPKVVQAPADNGGFKLQNYKTETWANGLQVILIEQHGLPSVSFGLLVKEGTASDPMAKSGLMHLMARVMVRGTDKLSASQIAENLGQLGSEFDQSVSDDYAWFQVSGLSMHHQKLWDIFSDVILHPRFDQSETERERQNTLAAMKRRLDHPDQFAGEAYEGFLYGGHPYGRPGIGLEGDVKSLKASDLMEAYKKYVIPNNSVLVITGDYTPGFLKSIKSKIVSWSKKELKPRGFTNPPVFTGLNLRVIDKPDLTQSQIVLGHFGINRKIDDFISLRIANTILGGNFSSRLMDQLRVKLGLTYGISSNFDARLDRGPFTISTFTKNESVGQAIKEILKEYKRFYEGGVTSDEVDASKNFIIGSFPRAIETPERLGLNLALLRLYDISDDYLKNFIANVNAVTPEQVNATIKQRFNAKDLKILVLTNSKQTIEQIRPVGIVEIKNFQQVF